MLVLLVSFSLLFRLNLGISIVLGCGVAGLTAALSCAYHGFTVDIYERAKTVETAIGGGLGLNGGLVGLTKMGYHSVFKDIIQPISKVFKISINSQPIPRSVVITSYCMIATCSNHNTILIIFI